MAVVLPRDALKRVQIGQSFAEYDLIRKDPQIFVSTPASIVATQVDSGKCFFIGRRGSGKTAISYHILAQKRRAVLLAPQVFDLIRLPLEQTEFKDTRQRPFRSLVCAFERALLCELVRNWVKNRTWNYGDGDSVITKDRGLIENCDFDTRVLTVTQEIFEAYNNPNQRLWTRQLSRSSDLIKDVNNIRTDGNFDFIFLIDRLDEAWDGSESAVISLMALMHSCVHLTAACPSIRPLLFLRENIYSRIRTMDNEFSRLETAVVFLDWTTEKLVEFVERRLVRPFNTKPALGGEAWSHFFQDSNDFDSKATIFTYCQNRPRDVLTYASFAIESAIARNHTKVQAGDIENACERFSTSKLKDLADEFTENYPNIQLVLSLFYGLSTEYTLLALENFIQKLLVDRKVQGYCGKWFYEYSTPHRFVELLYGIGFLGVKHEGGWTFKTAGGESGFLPALQQATTFQVHPAYHAALHLRAMILPALNDETLLRQNGILEELPEGVSFDDYHTQIKKLLSDLDYITRGRTEAGVFEECVGEIIKLCFFRSLSNVQSKVRDHEGSVIRDWVASNRAAAGFWQMIKEQYGATQIVWECKNYNDLKADDFHQACYYMQQGLRIVVIAFRGDEIKDAYYKHIQRACQAVKGIILLLMEKDLKVFLRQASNGKNKEDHIYEIFDRMVRSIT